MVVLPSGTVTFLFTDIEGSTARWEAAPDQMRVDLALHNSILDGVMAEYGGAVFKTVGDAYCVAFANAEEAVTAAMQTQARMAADCPGLKVRIGLHTGSIDPTGSDYFGQPLNRVARIMDVASGGQILLSEATKALLPSDLPLRDLGRQVLKDLLEPTGVWQIGAGEFGPLRCLGSVRNNLPLQTTSFVGRQTELADIRAILQKSRLITLTGTGGTGKSRLSLQLVAENVDQFPDGAWFVELAALPEREDVLREVISSIGAPESGGTPLERIAAHFKQLTSCLILDNCEHVLSIASDLAERLVRSCPNLTVIATSREPLGASGETVYRVPSLPAPDLRQAFSLREIDRFGACALFVERLATAAPEYGLQDEDALTIAKICTRLDGIPLALELAAARGRSMRLDQVEKRLDDRFRLLTGGSRNALSRQQTLQALIDWSIQLLNDTERNLFASLAVFAGGWKLEAAEAVCGREPLGVEPWEILDLLSALVDKSLIIFEHSSGRYKMLESLRQYAADLMARADFALEIRDRHADYYLALADPKVEYSMVLPPSCQEVFVAEYENIRAAFEWSRGESSRAAKASRVASALWPAFMMLERSAELVRQLEPLIEAASPVVSSDEKLQFQIIFAVACARCSDSRALDILEALGPSLDSMSHVQRLRVGTALAYAYFRAGRFGESLVVLLPLVELQVGPENHYYAYVFTMLGLDYACLGELERAASATERACVEMLIREDYRGWSAAKANLAMIAAISGRSSEAVQHAMEHNFVATIRRVNLKIRAQMLCVFGEAALNAGTRELAAILTGGGFASASQDVDPNDPLDSMFSDYILDLFKRSFDPAELRSLMECGRRHDWEPWLLAVADLKPEDQFVDGHFVVPFPELIAKAPGNGPV